MGCVQVIQMGMLDQESDKLSPQGSSNQASTSH